MKSRENREDIRPQYEAFGVTGFYAKRGADYRNPHESAIREIIGLAKDRWAPDLSNVLDLACGSGEVTLALREAAGDDLKVSGIDPYTAEACLERTGQPAERISFEQIAEGAIAGREYSLIVCSFAMHLIDRSWLPALLAQLAMISKTLWILTPHKRPEIRPEWGWTLEDEITHRCVRIRSYTNSGNRTEVS